MLKHFRWALLWALVILVLCLIPGRSLPQWGWFDLLDLDKSVHAGMFFVLAVLLAQAFRAIGRPKRWVLTAVAIAIAYGIGMEYMQDLEALGRRLDPMDMIANSVGALLAAWYITWRTKRGKPIVPLAVLR